jgi:hypothetical protein
MAEQQNRSKNMVKDISFRVVKAAIKAIVIYLFYFLGAPMLAPLFGLLPGLMESIEAFVIVYIVLMILGDLTARTIFQYFFNTARALFVIGYLLLSMGDGMINTSYENFSLTVNLTLLYTVATTLSLLGFASSILHAINFMHERAEASSGLQP